MENGYQYELGNKFPFQYKWLEVPVNETKEPENIELPLLKAKTGIVTPRKRITIRHNSVSRRQSANLEQPIAFRQRIMLRDRKFVTDKIDGDGMFSNAITNDMLYSIN